MPAAFRGDRRYKRSGDVVDVDAVEHLPRLDDAVRLALGEIDERVPSRAVDAGDAKCRQRHAALGGELRPRPLGREALGRTPAGRVRRRRLAHPRAAVVAVDADGRQVADPLQVRRGEDRLAMMREHRIGFARARSRRECASRRGPRQRRPRLPPRRRR